MIATADSRTDFDPGIFDEIDRIDDGGYPYDRAVYGWQRAGLTMDTQYELAVDADRHLRDGHSMSRQQMVGYRACLDGLGYALGSDVSRGNEGAAAMLVNVTDMSEAAKAASRFAIDN